MRHSILLFAIAGILTTGCTTPSEKSSPAYHSRLTQIAPTREAYYANLQSLSEYDRELQRRCDRIPELASVCHADFMSLRNAEERMEAILSTLQSNAEHWRLQNKLLLALEAQLQQLDEILRKIEEMGK